MKNNVFHIALSVSVLALVLGTATLPVYAQPNVIFRPDKSAYAPGDAVTLTVTIFNTPGNPGLEVRNITVYAPWAGLDTNGKWLANSNYTLNLSPTIKLAPSGPTNYTYTSQSMTIPSWWGQGSGRQPGTSCPGTTTRRLGSYSGCFLIGTNETQFRGTTTGYDGFDWGIAMAAPFYNPSSLSALQTWVPVATLVVLVIATAILAMVMLRINNLSRKQ